jgi:uncharacterized integral membrane protein
MNFKTKRHNKKMSKVFFTLAYCMVIIWALMIVTLIIMMITSTKLIHNSNNTGLLVTISFFLPLILGILFGFIGQSFLNERITYKANIKEYRQRKFFTQTLLLIREGNLNKAIDTYGLVTKYEYHKFLYPFFLNEFLHSTDEIQQKKGETKLAIVLDECSPDSINFN